MRHLFTPETLIAARLAIASGVAMTAYAAITLIVKILPNDHPSRTYVNGRVQVARPRVRTALRNPHS